jgi:sporulation protein YlmC with PRC-barrel domain
MKLTDFELLEVVTESGERLGRVFDIRIHGRPTARDHAPSARVDALVFGTLGLLERLGVRRANSRILPWERVVALRDGRVIVRDPDR